MTMQRSINPKQLLNTIFDICTRLKSMSVYSKRKENFIKRIENEIADAVGKKIITDKEYITYNQIVNRFKCKLKDLKTLKIKILKEQAEKNKKLKEYNALIKKRNLIMGEKIIINAKCKRSVRPIVTYEYLNIKAIIQSGVFNKVDLLNKIQQLPYKDQVKLKSLLLINSDKLLIEELDWELLPPSKCTLQKLKLFYVEYSNNNDYDLSRLTVLFSLKPIAVYKGKNSFNLYHAFIFDHTKNIVLECPKIGNAMYILRDNWKELSKLTKSELIEQHKESISRIVHHDISITQLRNAILY